MVLEMKVEYMVIHETLMSSFFTLSTYEIIIENFYFNTSKRFVLWSLIFLCCFIKCCFIRMVNILIYIFNYKQLHNYLLL